MPNTFGASVQGTLFGQQYVQDLSATGDMGIPFSPEVPVCKDGALTTRTSASVGTLTMDAGHGIVDGDIIAIYWDDDDALSVVAGVRVGVVVGTVATNSVPFTGGTGDDLPLDETVIRAMTLHQEDLVVDGDNVVAIAVQAGSYRSTFSFYEAADAVAYAITLEPNTSFIWTLTSGITNPLAGKSVETIRFSHENSDAVQTLNGAILYD